jgi:hypothetical protein
LWGLALAVPSMMSQLTATTSHIKNATNATTKEDQSQLEYKTNIPMTVMTKK